jgi:uncharacterized protein (UPF0332 family)
VFDWHDYLHLADRLALVGDEAEQRSAISRAYYAVYHAASAFVRARSLVPSGRRLTHDLVWNALISDPNPDRANAGVRGDRLKRSRHDADYRAPFPGDLERRVRDVLAESRAMIDDIDQLP